VCSREERWQRDTTFAVYRGQNKRATKVCGSDDEAARYIARQKTGQWRVERRAGEAVRCQDYCEVAPFCRFGKRVLAGDVPDDREFGTVPNAAPDDSGDVLDEDEIQYPEIVAERYFGIGDQGEADPWHKSPEIWRRCMEIHGKTPEDLRAIYFPAAKGGDA
jgi:hypothetical protein